MRTGRRRWWYEKIGKAPSKLYRDAILKAQGNRCFYCGSVFNEFFLYKRKVRCAVVTWDHLLPFTYSHSNSPKNFVAACRECNNIKGARIFNSVEEAIHYVRQERNNRGLPVFKLPGTIHTKEEMAEILQGQVPDGVLLEASQGCLNCGLPIIGRKFWAKFCSTSCTNAYGLRKRIQARRNSRLMSVEQDKPSS